MISTKLRYLILLVAAMSTLPLKAASQVWITPSTASTSTIPTYSEDPFGFLKNLVAPTVQYKQLYQTPSGTKFYFVGSTNDAVYVYNSDLSSQSKSFPLGFNSPGAAQ